MGLQERKMSALAKELLTDVAVVESIPQPSACITDRMAMVQRLKENHKTFANMSDALLSMILREGAASKRIDVVLDVYRDTLIKKSREIQERGLNVN